MANVAIDRRGIGPIRLDRNDRETVLLDEPAGDRRACPVELRRSMTCFAKQNDAPVGEPIEQLAEGLIVEIRKRLGRHGDHIGQTGGMRMLGLTTGFSELAAFGPALLADQRDEPYAAEILLAVGCSARSGDFE